MLKTDSIGLLYFIIQFFNSHDFSATIQQTRFLFLLIFIDEK